MPHTCPFPFALLFEVLAYFTHPKKFRSFLYIICHYYFFSCWFCCLSLLRHEFIRSIAFCSFHLSFHACFALFSHFFVQRLKHCLHSPSIQLTFMCGMYVWVLACKSTITDTCLKQRMNISENECLVNFSFQFLLRCVSLHSSPATPLPSVLSLVSCIIMYE